MANRAKEALGKFWKWNADQFNDPEPVVSFWAVEKEGKTTDCRVDFFGSRIEWHDVPEKQLEQRKVKRLK